MKQSVYINAELRLGNLRCIMQMPKVKWIDMPAMQLDEGMYRMFRFERRPYQDKDADPVVYDWYGFVKSRKVKNAHTK